MAKQPVSSVNKQGSDALTIFGKPAISAKDETANEVPHPYNTAQETGHRTQAALVFVVILYLSPLLSSRTSSV